MFLQNRTHSVSKQHQDEYDRLTQSGKQYIVCDELTILKPCNNFPAIGDFSKNVTIRWRILLVVGITSKVNASISTTKRASTRAAGKFILWEAKVVYHRCVRNVVKACDDFQNDAVLLFTERLYVQCSGIRHNCHRWLGTSSKQYWLPVITPCPFRERSLPAP